MHEESVNLSKHLTLFLLFIFRLQSAAVENTYKISWSVSISAQIYEKCTPYIIPIFLDKIWIDMHRTSKHHTVLLIFQSGGKRDLGWHSAMCVWELLSQASKNDSVGSQLKSGRTFELSVKKQANMYWANIGSHEYLLMYYVIIAGYFSAKWCIGHR